MEELGDDFVFGLQLLWQLLDTFVVVACLSFGGSGRLEGMFDLSQRGVPAQPPRIIVGWTFICSAI